MTDRQTLDFKIFCNRKLGKVSFEKKKKKCEISHLGGGSGQNWVIFTLFYFFFFHVLNNANLQRKNFSVWGGGTPLPESPKILDMLGKNLEIFLSFMDL